MYGQGSGGSRMDPRWSGPLCYALGPITGIYFLITEKHDRGIKFHAWQSTLLFFGLWALVILAGMVARLLFYLPVVGGIGYFLAGLLNMAVAWIWFAATVFLMLKAYQGERYQLPVVGDLAAQYAYR